MTDKHTLAPPELAERALVEELATQMALAAGYAPHCWPTWEQEATVIIPTIAKHMATRITALEAREAELVEAAEALKQDLLERAEWDRSEAVKIVAAGNGVWSRFCATLAKARQSEGGE